MDSPASPGDKGAATPSEDVSSPAEGDAPVVEITGYVLSGDEESALSGPAAIPRDQQPEVELTPDLPAVPDLSMSDEDLSAQAARTAAEAPSTPAPLWFLVVTSTLVAAADIASKEWIKYAVAGPDLKRTAKAVELIKDHVGFIFAQNPGGAWSFLRGVPDGLRRPFFLFVSAAAIVFIVSVYRKLDQKQWAMRWGLPLALGGAIGNLQDRVRYGWVVDFIDIRLGDWAPRWVNPWPTFNVADIAIVLGVGLMALDLLQLRKHRPGSGAPAPAETAGGAA